MGIFSSIGKFLFGGSKKTSESKTSGTTDIDPYSPVIPYINKYLGETDALYGNAPMFSDLEQQGYDSLRSTVNSGAGNVDRAISANNDTISGKYLTPDTNPYLRDIASRISSIAGSNANTTFSGKGRSGSGLAGYYNGKAVGDSLTDMYGSVYESERGRQSEAIGRAPSLAQGAFLAPQAMISAGQNVSARPFDINQQKGGILAAIGRLGQQGTTTGQQTNYAQNPGLIGGIVNSFTNKLFGGNGATPVAPW